MNKGLSIVDAFLLRESFHDETSFAMLKITIEAEFGSMYPLTLGKIISSWSRR